MELLIFFFRQYPKSNQPINTVFFLLFECNLLPLNIFFEIPLQLKIYTYINNKTKKITPNNDFYMHSSLQ